jgi:hypothetical protein
MATAKRITPKRHPFYTALVALGCKFCETCHAYMYPDHVAHVTAFDRHTRETFPPVAVTLTAEPLTAPAAA